MSKKLFKSLEEITAACKDETGKYLAIPLLEQVQLIDNEIYGYVGKFCNQYGMEVDETITSHILAKLTKQFN